MRDLSRSHRAHRPRWVAATALILAFVAFVAGCAEPRDPVPAPSSSAPLDPLSQPRITPEAVPEFVEDGTADDNLDYFAFRLNALLAQESQPSSRQVVDSLVDSGFDKSAMSVTADTTPVGIPADSILVSVLFGDSCLLGQVDDGSFVTQTADVLSTGRCFVGRTLSIDW